jgi:hypothetical protein
VSESIHEDTPAPTPGDDAGQGGTGQTERTGCPAASRIETPTRAKRWGRNAFFLGTLGTIVTIAVVAIDDHFSDSIASYVGMVLIIAPLMGCMAAMMGISFGLMADHLGELTMFRSKEVDRALEAVEDGEATRKWASQPPGRDEPSETDANSDLDLPPLKDTDIISSRAPARHNPAPTDIQPGEPQP